MIQSRLKKGEESKGLERRNMVGSARAAVKTVDQSGFCGRSLPAALPRPQCTGSRGVFRLSTGSKPLSERETSVGASSDAGT